MSSKQTSKKTNVDHLDPRIAPKEMIITRHKSALQKRQLRNKDRSMKSITRLLKGQPKSPTLRTTKLPQKKIKDVQKDTQKKLERNVNLKMEEKEFYPNMLKRNLVAKKILLKPKYNMKVIAGTNKRKLGTPHRGVNSPLPMERSNHWLAKSEIELNNQGLQSESPVCSSPELSMAEVIRIAEETHSLDDEDLMEILTCPSPVWWEDPPDSGYDEDAIFMNEQKEENNEFKDKDSTSEERNEADKQIGLHVNIENRDSNFKKKRSKLENLLGSIKNKILGCENVPQLSNIKAKISPQIVDKINISESTEEETFSDISMNEDDVLKDLESIDIPIESNVKVESALADVIKQEIKTEVPKTMPRLKRCPIKIKDSPKKSSDVETLSSDFDSISDTNVRFIEEVEGSKTSTNESFIEDDGSKASDSSPKNNKAVNKGTVKAKRKTNKTTVIPEANTVTVSQSVDTELVSDLGLNHNNDIEYITVYKIMSNKNDSPKSDNMKEINDQPKQKDVSTKRTKNQLNDRDNKRKLNLFFKKCKSNRRSKNKTQNVIKADDKSVSVEQLDKNSMLVSGNNTVKYCYKCSSIFDTDECSYCKRKSKITIQNKQCVCTDRCNCDRNNEIFTCNVCDFKTDTKMNLDEHLLIHNSNMNEETVNNCRNPEGNQLNYPVLSDQMNSSTNECRASC